VHEEWWMLDLLYFLSAASIMAIVFVIVFYAFRLARDAQERSDALLLNVMPEAIAGRLKKAPEKTIADHYDEATVLFADMVGFTPLSARLGAEQMVGLLDELFSSFDALAAKYGVEKIKTVGDAYMVVSGVPAPRPDHAQAAARFALDLFGAVADFNERTGNSLNLRIGIATGPLMAGVIGRSKFAYDVWGPTVNLAARLEAYGEPGEVHISVVTADLLGEDFQLAALGERQIKGIGSQAVHHLKAQKQTAPAL